MTFLDLCFLGLVIPVPLQLALQPKQLLTLLSNATEILFGGAAFGGKSHLLRAAAIIWCTEIPGLNVYLFRRVEDDLIKNHMEGPHGFRALLAEWEEKKLVRITETSIEFTFNKSHIFLCHCKDEKHRFKYHGAEIHVLMIDELTTFTELIYRYLRFRTRMVGVKKDKDGKYLDSYPKKYRKGEAGPDGEVNVSDLFPRVLCGSNPGNVGHGWVKTAFVDAARVFEKWATPDEEGGFVRQFIQALMKDNPIGMEEDPDYVKRTRGLMDAALVKAMEVGDWNQLSGGYFPEFSLGRHVVKHFEIPTAWGRFTSTDWGSAKPFSTSWWAIAQEDMTVDGTVGNRIEIPKGSLVCYRNWYGLKPKHINVGLHMPVEAWADGVLYRSRLEKIEYDVCDGSMFAEDGGPSLAERAGNRTLKHGGRERELNLRPADKQRLSGWDQLRFRLVGDNPENGDDRPTIFWFDTYEHPIRCIQLLIRDELKREDADTDCEDHTCDENRYACMSRPRRKPDPQPINRGPKPLTMDWVASEAWKTRTPAIRSTYPME